MIKTHWGQHDKDCFGCKCATIQFESANEHAMEIRKRDRDFDRDAAAYKRLRAEGLQPRGVDKSAMLEAHADHAVQVQLGRPVLKEEIKAVNREIAPIR